MFRPLVMFQQIPSVSLGPKMTPTRVRGPDPLTSPWRLGGAAAGGCGSGHILKISKKTSEIAGNHMYIYI